MPPIVEAVKLAPPVAGMSEFYKRNPSIADAYWSKNQNLIIKLKNQSKEEYSLADEKEKNAFTEKYGNPPAALSPPPPPVPIRSWQ